MFQRIMVLLDGSERAELALPIAVQLARASGGSLFFLRMVGLPADCVWYSLEPPFLSQEVREAATRRAETYLAVKAWEMELAGITVHTSMIPNIPRQNLRSFIQTQAIDLVVMCSRGPLLSQCRTQGSMAQQVLLQSSAPVLILQEASGSRGIFYPRPQPVHILVLLDGLPLAEAAIAPVIFLAAALSAPSPSFLHFLYVLPSHEFLKAEEMDSQFKQRIKDQANASLQTLSQKLQTGILGQVPLSITTEVLYNSDVTNTILRVAQGTWREQAAETYHLIALMAHARSEREHQAIGKTAEQLFKGTGLPLLILPSDSSTQKDG